MKALIVQDGWLRGALPGVRALGRAGWEVHVASTDRTESAAASRWARAHHPLPPMAQDAHAWIASVADAARGMDVVLPGGDGELQVLATAHGRVGPSLAVPGPSSVDVLLDKLVLSERARAVGIAVPPMALAGDHADLPRPWIVKARSNWLPGTGTAPGRWESVQVHDDTEADRRIAEVQAGGGRPFVQSQVAGGLVGLSVVVDRAGRLRGVAQHTGDGSTLPPSAGMRTRAWTVPVDLDLAERCAQLLHSIGWWGLADLDFVLMDDQPALIDANGRLFGTLPLVEAAGVDLVDRWARLAVGHELQGCPMGRPGISYQWFEGDLRRALRERRRGLVADLRETTRMARGAVHHTWSRDDRAPTWSLLRHLARRMGRRVRRTPARPRGPAG